MASLAGSAMPACVSASHYCRVCAPHPLKKRKICLKVTHPEEMLVAPTFENLRGGITI